MIPIPEAATQDAQELMTIDAKSRIKKTHNGRSQTAEKLAVSKVGRSARREHIFLVSQVRQASFSLILNSTGSKVKQPE